jgi:multidrug transporter EmrE-like cation transporter
VLTIAFILVLCSGLLNATWNLFTKRSLNKAVFLWFIHLIATIMYMPTFIYELATAPIGGYGYAMMALSFIFQAIYGLLLAKAYTIGDLSQVYPIMRGTGAMLVPVIGVCFMDESLSMFGWVGLTALLLGIYNQSGLKFIRKQEDTAATLAPILVAFAIGLCITGYTLTDKVTLQYVSPLALIQVSHLGYLCSLTWGALRSKQIGKEWKVNWKTILLGAIIAPGS